MASSNSKVKALRRSFGDDFAEAGRLEDKVVDGEGNWSCFEDSEMMRLAIMDQLNRGYNEQVYD